MATVSLYGPYKWNGPMPGGQGHAWTVRIPRGGKVFNISAIPYFVGDAAGDFFSNVLSVQDVSVVRDTGGSGHYLNFVVRNTGVVPLSTYEWHFMSVS